MKHENYIAFSFCVHNTDLLKYSHAHLFMYFPAFMLQRQRPYGPQSQKYSLSGPWKRSFHDVVSRPSTLCLQCRMQIETWANSGHFCASLNTFSAPQRRELNYTTTMTFHFPPFCCSVYIYTMHLLIYLIRPNNFLKWRLIPPKIRYLRPSTLP